MPSEPAFDPRILNQFLEQLACPACYGTLRLSESANTIACANCDRCYPLIEGIPVLIAERASNS